MKGPNRDSKAFEIGHVYVDMTVRQFSQMISMIARSVSEAD